MPYLTLIGLLLIAGAVISRLKLVPPNILLLILGGAILIAAVAWAVSSAKPRKDNAGNQSGSNNDNKARDSGPEDSKSPPKDEPPKTPPPAPEKPAGIDVGRTFGIMMLWLIPLFIIFLWINGIPSHWIRPEKTIPGAIANKADEQKKTERDWKLYKELNLVWGKEEILPPGDYKTDGMFSTNYRIYEPGIGKVISLEEKAGVFFKPNDKQHPIVKIWKKE